MPSTASKRAASQELLDDEALAKQSKTGRSTRSTAGRRSLPTGFVNTEEAIHQSDEDDSALSDSELDDDDQHRRLSHRRRGRSPPPPELEEAIESDNLQRRTSNTPSEFSSFNPSMLSLTFHVPPGHQGPFVVNLQLPSMTSPNAMSFSSSSGSSPSNAQTPCSGISATPVATSVVQPRKKPLTLKRKRAGFLDLPAELRNDIYKRIIVTPDNPIIFRSATNFSGHSAALLRTCKTVYHEARQFLYGEHEFQFSRCVRDRGQFWEEWKEVGWKDVRRFLSTIGPANIAELRTIHFSLTDASNNNAKDSEFSRYTFDDHLLEAFKLLAQHAALQTITLEFHGRGIVKQEHERFLYNLRAIQADTVNISGASEPNNHSRHYWRGDRRYGTAKVDIDVGKELVKKMQRKKPLYS